MKYYSSFSIYLNRQEKYNRNILLINSAPLLSSATPDAMHRNLTLFRDKLQSVDYLILDSFKTNPSSEIIIAKSRVLYSMDDAFSFVLLAFNHNIIYQTEYLLNSYRKQGQMTIEAGDAIVLIDKRPELHWWKGQNQRSLEVGLFPR